MLWFWRGWTYGYRYRNDITWKGCTQLLASFRGKKTLSWILSLLIPKHHSAVWNVYLDYIFIYIYMHISCFSNIIDVWPFLLLGNKFLTKQRKNQPTRRVWCQIYQQKWGLQHNRRIFELNRGFKLQTTSGWLVPLLLPTKNALFRLSKRLSQKAAFPQKQKTNQPKETTNQNKTSTKRTKKQTNPKNTNHK